MAVTITIAGVDRTSLVSMGSVRKKDAVNQQTDTLDFTIIYKPGQSFRPTSNSDVVMTDNQSGTTDRVFGGKIYSVTAHTDSKGMVEYLVKCKDYSYDLGRQLVNELYENMTVTDIIDDILTNFTDGTFTMVGVDCDIMITKYAFQRVNVVQAIQTLADVTGFSWYVDYYKDVHFFATNTEQTPFDLTDYDGNYISSSLEISDDFSQIRNRVFVQGGEVEGNSRTETFNGDGVKKQFKLANKFASVPTVTVGGVGKTVGIDNLDDEASFDLFWDYNQQYIRFNNGSGAPAVGTNNIAVTGIPLYTLVIQVENAPSIASYGVFEYSKTDVNIKSREEGIGLAKSEITAYKDGVVEGSFSTYTPGLRSGQVIHITSTLFGIDEDFVIQSTSFRMINKDKGQWDVKVATLRTVDLINFLIGLLKLPGNLIDQTGDVILEKTVFPIETIGITETIGINTNDYPAAEGIGVDDTTYVQTLNAAYVFVAGPWIPDPTTGTDLKRQFILDGSPLG